MLLVLFSCFSLPMSTPPSWLTYFLYSLFSADLYLFNLPRFHFFYSPPHVPLSFLHSTFSIISVSHLFPWLLSFLFLSVVHFPFKNAPFTVLCTSAFKMSSAKENWSSVSPLTSVYTSIFISNYIGQIHPLYPSILNFNNILKKMTQYLTVLINSVINIKQVTGLYNCLFFSSYMIDPI